MQTTVNQYSVAYEVGLSQLYDNQLNSSLQCSSEIRTLDYNKGGNVTSAGWQVALCDPMRHVSSCSGVATLRTAIHLLLTYLQ